jgi:hypothetical protein
LNGSHNQTLNPTSLISQIDKNCSTSIEPINDQVKNALPAHPVSDYTYLRRVDRQNIVKGFISRRGVGSIDKAQAI